MKRKLNLIKKITEAGVIRILIIFPLTVETMQQLIIKPWKRSLGTWSTKKMIKSKRFKNFKKLQIFLKNADFKILNNNPLHLESMQWPIIKPRGDYAALETKET